MRIPEDILNDLYRYRILNSVAISKIQIITEYQENQKVKGIQTKLAAKHHVSKGYISRLVHPKTGKK